MNEINGKTKTTRITVEVEGQEPYDIEGEYFLISVGTLNQTKDLIRSAYAYGGDYAHLCRLAVGQCAYISKNFEKAVKKVEKKLSKLREKK